MLVLLVGNFSKILTAETLTKTNHTKPQSNQSMASKSSNVRWPPKPDRHKPHHLPQMICVHSRSCCRAVRQPGGSAWRVRGHMCHMRYMCWEKNLRPQDFISSFSLLKLLNLRYNPRFHANEPHPKGENLCPQLFIPSFEKINHAFSCTWIMLLIGFFWNIWNQPVQCLQVPAPQTDQTSLVILVCLTSRCWCWLLFGRHLAASSSQNPRCTAPRIIRILFHSWNCWTYDTTHVSQVNQKYQDNQVNGRRPNGDNLWPLFLS